jgi:hypothetical protein
MSGSIFHPFQTERLDCVDLPTTFWLRLEGDAALNLCTIARRFERPVGWSSAPRLWNAAASTAGPSSTQIGRDTSQIRMAKHPLGFPIQSGGAPLWSAFGQAKSFEM